MLTRFINTLIFALVTGALTSSCTEDIPDCPTKLCVIAGGWQLVEVRFDNEKYEEDFSKFRLWLNDPETTTATTASFERTTISGNEEAGTWSVENMNPDASTPFKGSILRLKPQGDDQLREDWNIESFTPRQMILVLNRNTTVKDGPATIHFILEPFQAQ